jgi:hypothetical protein
MQQRTFAFDLTPMILGLDGERQRGAEAPQLEESALLPLSARSLAPSLPRELSCQNPHPHSFHHPTESLLLPSSLPSYRQPLLQMLKTLSFSYRRQHPSP